MSCYYRRRVSSSAAAVASVGVAAAVVVTFFVLTLMLTLTIAHAQSTRPALSLVSSAMPSYTLSVIDSVPVQPNVTYASTAFVEGSSGVRDGISIGFNFFFFGQSYNRVGVGYNGNLQWNASNVGGNQPDAIPTTNINVPMFAWLASDLNCVRNLCGGGFGVIGTAPSRTFLIRALNWTYQGSSSSVGSGDVDVDILLNETSNAIEVRYYSVSNAPDTRPISVGAQFNMTRWVSVFNRSINLDATSNLQGRTLIFTPVTSSSSSSGDSSSSSAAAPAAVSSSSAAGQPTVRSSSIIATPLPASSSAVQPAVSSSAAATQPIALSSSAPSTSGPRPTLSLVSSALPSYTLSVIDSVPVQPNVTYASTAFVEGSSGVRDGISIGFNFLFFGQSYNRVGVGYNGNLQWNASNVGGNQPDAIPTTNINVPMFAWLASDLNCVRNLCGGGFGVIGTAPSRTFLIRALNWTYQGSSSSVGSGDVDVDILLNETSNAIEVRYYSVSNAPDTRPISVGAQFDMTRWVSVFNRSVSLDTTSNLQGRTLIFTPVASPVSPAASSSAAASTPTPVTSSSAAPSTPALSSSAPAPAPVSFSSSARASIARPTLSLVSSTTPSYSLTVRESVPAKLNLTFTDPFELGSNGVRENEAIGFNFYFFGRMYNRVGIGYNGNLQWNASAVSGVYPDAIPTANFAAPIFAWFATDLNCISGLCGGGYSVIGTAPYRSFLIRIINWTYQSSSASTGSGDLDVDILLNETTNAIEVRYYSVTNAPDTRAISIGAQFNLTQWVSVFNRSVSLDATWNLEGRTLVFTPLVNNVPRPALPVARSAPSSFYDVTVMDSVVSPVTVTPYYGSPITSGYQGVRQNQYIGFTFNFFGTNYDHFGIGYNGNLQWGSSELSGVLPDQIPSSTLSVPVFAWLGTNLNCVQGLCGGGYSFGGTAPYRTLVFRAVNWTYEVNTTVQGSGDVDVDVVLYETTNVIEVRYYTVSAPPAAYTVTIGMQNSTTNWLSVFNRTSSVDLAYYLQGRTLVFTPSTPFPASAASSGSTVPTGPTEPTATTSTASSYTFSWTNSVPAQKIAFNLTGAAFSSGSNGVRENQAIGFPFYFFGRMYDRLGIGYNGNVQWNSSASNGILPTGIPSSSLSAPILAWYGNNLNLVSGLAGGGYGVVGTAPNRVFVIRAVNWTYEGATASVGSGDLDIDILLHETTNVIEIRYYSVSPLPSSSFPLTIGVQSSVSDWVAVVSQATNVNATQLLQGRTLFFTPVPGSNNARSSTGSNDAVVMPSSAGRTVPPPVTQDSSSAVAMSSSGVEIVPDLSSASSSSSLSSGAIAGIVIGVVVFCVIAVVVLFFFTRRSGAKWETEHPEHQAHAAAMSGVESVEMAEVSHTRTDGASLDDVVHEAAEETEAAV